MSITADQLMAALPTSTPMLGFPDKPCYRNRNGEILNTVNILMVAHTLEQFHQGQCDKAFMLKEIRDCLGDKAADRCETLRLHNKRHLGFKGLVYWAEPFKPKMPTRDLYRQQYWYLMV
tara:strand:- start:232 stop:588 length:357 start_codon:yes stop_codon:yes gene_type:complete